MDAPPAPESALRLPIAWMVRWNPATDDLYLADDRAGAWRMESATTSAEGPAVGRGLALSAPAPSPAYGRLALTLTTPAAGDVRVEVLDALGRRVGTLHEGPLAAGVHDFALDATHLAPGLYVLRATVGGASAAQRLTVIR